MEEILGKKELAFQEDGGWDVKGSAIEGIAAIKSIYRDGCIRCMHGAQGITHEVHRVLAGKQYNRWGEGKYGARQTGRKKERQKEREVGALGRTWRHSGESNDIGLLD